MSSDETALHQAVRKHREATEALARAVFRVRSLPRSQLDVLTDFELEILFRDSTRVCVATRSITASELLRRVASRSPFHGIPFRVLEHLLEALERGSDAKRLETLTALAAGLNDLRTILARS